MDHWQQESHTSSPDSIIQAVVLGLGAVLLLGGLFLIRELDVLSYAKWPEQERSEPPPPCHS